MAIANKRIEPTGRLMMAAAIAITGFTFDSASARPKSKPAPRLFEVAAATPFNLPSVPTQYFTINEILAKRDGHPALRASIRLASLEPLGLRGSLSHTRPHIGPPPTSDAPFGLTTFR